MVLFRVPKFTEYALRSLTCLAQCGQRMSVREIAEREGLHPASLAKILHMLCWQGLVHSKRGRQGGFWLARASDRIQVKEVVEIFQGPFDTPEPPAEEGFLAAWESLYAPMRQALENLTLADLLHFQRGSAPPPSKARAPQEGGAPPKSYARRQRAV
ncbi:MAG: RrF2 family transcriptional regulator [Terriglobia bacterium]